MSVHDVKPYPEECERARELLGARVDGRLAPGEEVLLRDHLDECSECHAVATWMPAIDGLAQSNELTHRPGDAYFDRVRESVMEKVASIGPEPVSKGSRRPAWLRWPVLAPAAVVVAMLGFFTLRQAEQMPLPTETASVPETVEFRGLVEHDDAQSSTAGADAETEAVDVPSGLRTAPPAPTRVPLEESADENAVIGAAETLPDGKSTARRSLDMEISRFESQELYELPSTPASLRDIAPPSLRQAFVLAAARQDTDDEDAALNRVLDLMEFEAREQKTDERQDEDLSLEAGRERTAKAEPQALAQTAPAVTLADSIAVHLQQRLPAVQDPTLRDRIEAWLRLR